MEFVEFLLGRAFMIFFRFLQSKVISQGMERMIRKNKHTCSTSTVPKTHHLYLPLQKM